MVEIDEELVRQLVAEQLPRWRDLPVRAVPRQGWDNRTFRLGDELSVRLPSGPGYADAVAKEDRWLPVLAGSLPLAVPEPVATGEPGQGYPFPWSVRRWLPGTPLDAARGLDADALADDLGAFLAALRSLPAADGPPGGEQSMGRGLHPEVYADDVERALTVVGTTVDPAACRATWRVTTASAWTADPVWFHGDVAVGNLLAVDGRLCAVIDWGGCGVGDPACDLVPAWTIFEAGTRERFRNAAGLDDRTWARARAWALWKCLRTLAAGGPQQDDQLRVLREVLAPG